MKMAHVFARVAKHDSTWRFNEAQYVDNSMFKFIWGHAHGAVFNIGMGAFGTLGFDTQGIALVFFSHQCNGLWHGGREHQRAALFGRGFEDEFQIFAETQV